MHLLIQLHIIFYNGGFNGYRLRNPGKKPHEAAGRATNHSLLLHNLGHFHDGDQTKVKAGCCQRRFLFHEPKAGARLNAFYWVQHVISTVANPMIIYS